MIIAENLSCPWISKIKLYMKVHERFGITKDYIISNRRTVWDEEDDLIQASSVLFVLIRISMDHKYIIYSDSFSKSNDKFLSPRGLKGASSTRPRSMSSTTRNRLFKSLRIIILCQLIGQLMCLTSLSSCRRHRTWADRWGPLQTPRW